MAVIRRYFAEGFWTAPDLNRLTGLVGAYHRTLSTYLNTLAEAGLVLREPREPRATATFAVRKPGYREVLNFVDAGTSSLLSAQVSTDYHAETAFDAVVAFLQQWGAAQEADL